MALISLENIQDILKLKKFGFLSRGISWLIIKILKIDQINSVYNKVKDLPINNFLDQLLKNLNVIYSIHEEDLKRIPRKGSCIIVSNHPLGALDGIILMKIVSSIRPDFKIMANFLLEKIGPLKDNILSVNPFEDYKETFDSKRGLINAFQYLREDHCVIIFPAGEVSHYDSENNEYVDREWVESSLKFIEKSKVPIIPIYFHAKNSKLFYNSYKLSPTLRTALIPMEMLRKRKRPIQLRIGKLISVKQQEKYTDIKEYGNFLRNKVYMLRYFYTENKKAFKKLKFFPVSRITQSANSDKAKPIIDETPAHSIKKEIDLLKEIDGQLFANYQYEIYFSKAENIPNILREIGRLREITFRKIGEGTNEAFDLDEFDQFYYHLFLWDNERQIIVGSYRMGMGKEIYDQYGINGFYTSSLFVYDAELNDFFSEAIEMGRAFIIEEFQQKPLPLFLLWRGIVHVCLRNPHYKYMIGGVSISNQFSKFSKSIMVEFMRSNYFDAAIAQFVHPKNEFKVKLKENEKILFFDAADKDLNKFDKLIDELEPSLRLPVLIKRYLKQNARVVAFNVDPKFNDAIDGLMYIRISDLPENTIKPVLEELQSEMDEKIQEDNKSM